jgi:hypothetical protein
VIAAERSIARVEARRLARNPGLWAALLVGAWWVRWTLVEDDPRSTYFLLVGYSLLLPAVVVLVVTDLAVLRSRSAGADELFDTLPVGRDRRTVAHLLSGLFGVALGVVAVVLIGAVLRPAAVLGRLSDTIPAGFDLPRPGPAQLLQGPFVVLVACAFAVALARWLPSWLAMLALVVPLAGQALWFGLWMGSGTNLVSWTVPMSPGLVIGEWYGCGENDAVCQVEIAGIDRTTAWWHLGYLVALTLLFGALAVLRDRRDRRAWAALAVAMVLTASTVVAQAVVLRPFPAA